MYAKLNSDANEVIVLMTKAILAGEFQGARGPRKVYSNTTEEVTRWALGSQPDAYQISAMGKDAEHIMAWAREQDEAIKAAYVRNLESCLAGGKPVIVGTKAYTEIKDKGLEGFIDTAKTGEFCGVISGARSIAGLMYQEPMPTPEPAPEPVVEPEPAEEKEPEIETTLLPSMISDQLKQVSSGLLKAISSAVEEGEGITREEAYDIYVAERQIYYTLTRGLGIKANEYEKARRKAADKNFANAKKGSFGMALREAARMLNPED